jgi:hypothetical protein
MMSFFLFHRKKTFGFRLLISQICILGYFAHVSTLEDIQENVEDYIPVTARPIAMYNDHVTVWSSVFLDVERTLPIKTYKWFPFKLSDLSISMEEFKNKSKVKEYFSNK